VALILIDVINDLALRRQPRKHALPMAKRIATLKSRPGNVGFRAFMSMIPLLPSNPTFEIDSPLPRRRGPWQTPATILGPEDDDYFVLKPKHSGFYSTTLELLLRALGVHTLILTGIAGNICVLFTANDAYMRDYALVIPADCVASNTVQENKSALRLMQHVLKADIRPSTELDLQYLRASKQSQ
jgi:nicotinamidase-related amidase